MSWLKVILLVFCGFNLYGVTAQIKDRQRGAFIGKIMTLQHNVSGNVWAVDEDKLYIENFTYDGRGPDAFFWIGNSSQPSPRGHLIRYPLENTDGKEAVLPQMSGENILLHLPPELKVADMKWLSVWCRRFTVDFGNVVFPEALDPPRKRILPEFQRLAHGLRSGNITILDAKTFYIPNLHYDGLGPDAYFWVGKGTKPDPMGYKIPNEQNRLDVLRAYEGEDIELQLPGNLTVYDIDYLGMWCVQFKHNFGHVLIPRPEELWVPPALNQTRVKPSWWYEGEPGQQTRITPPEFKNCRQLSEDLKVEWQAQMDEVHIRLTAKMGEDQYVAFGRSSSDTKPEMLNSDLVVAYYDRDDGSFHAIDYSVTGPEQCDGTAGVCPDERVNGRNDASVIDGQRKNGITSITFSRPYETNDQKDIPISRYPDDITVIAAIGHLNAKKEASYHHQFLSKDQEKLDFSAAGDNQCGLVVEAERNPSKYSAWTPNVIRATTNFTAMIGPAGGEKGYEAITNIGSWGIAWWINEMLIPEIEVERGQTYYFTVYGGNDELNSARYHPLYITNNPEGGFGQKIQEEQSLETVYAGISYSIMGQPKPSAVGGLCEWRHSGLDAWKDSLTFEEYKGTLYKECESGQPGTLVWTVSEETPDLVYYQCYTHKNLGWKIHVVDNGYNLQQKGRNSGVASARVHTYHSLIIIAMLALMLPLR